MTTFQNNQQPGAEQQKPNGHNQGFGQRVDHLNQSAHQLMDEARGAVQELTSAIDLKGRVERNPYGMVLAAVGIGYVLGGGLFTPFTGRLLRLGTRLAMLPFVKDELLGMAEAAITGAMGGSSSADNQSPQGPRNV